jgi:CRISPR-associated protein (TIGR02710 family)
MTHLFITVGTGGPQNPVHEAIAKSIRELAPTAVTFLCSTKTEKDTLPLILYELGKKIPPHTVHTSPSPDNIARLSREYCELLDDARASHANTKVHADFTSGTKAMSSALCVAALITEASGLHYAIGPRDASGRATSTERMLSLDTASMLAERALPDMTNLFHVGAFEAVHHWATRTFPALEESKLRARVESLARLSIGYAKWDRFDYAGAADALTQCLGRKNLPTMLQAGWKEQTLRTTLEHLQACKAAANKKIPETPLLLDLIANARRCFHARRFDDAVARGYRAAEALGQFLLRRDHGITSTSDVPIGSIEKIAPITARTLNTKKGCCNLDRTAVLNVLCEAGNTHGANLANDDAMDKALRGRNNSLLAHGFVAVTEPTARKLLDLLDKHLSSILGRSAETELAAADFQRCPWADRKLDPWNALTID